MSVMGICNKGAGALAPLVMGTFLLRDSDALVERLKTMNVAAESNSIRCPGFKSDYSLYYYCGCIDCSCLLYLFFNLPEVKAEGEEVEKTRITVPNKRFSVFLIYG